MNSFFASPALRASLDFWQQHADVPMNFCRTEVYVGTPLMHRLAREGRLIGDEFGWDYHISDPRAEIAFRVFARALYDRIDSTTKDEGITDDVLASLAPRA